MSTSSDKVNLARIRDNQRRSRARRKEYLQELEVKLRACELMGVEASAEIQNAARRVADENRKLRSLLRERGVVDGEVEGWLKSADGSAIGREAFPGGEKEKPAEVLQTLLNTRKTCYHDGTSRSSSGSVGPSTNLENGVTNSGHDDFVLASMGTTPTVWSPAFSTAETESTVSVSMAPHQQQYQQYMSPGPSVNPINTGQVYPVSMQQHVMPMAKGTTARSASTSPRSRTSQSGFNQWYDFETQLALLQQQNAHFVPSHAMQLMQAQQQQQQAQQHQVGMTAPPVQHPQSHMRSLTTPLSNNGDYQQQLGGAPGAGTGMDCNSAADMVTSMTAGNADPMDVRADLGCLLQDGRDCRVDNQVVFDIMDRYSGLGVGS